MDEKKIVIFGCGGHSRTVVDILLSKEKKGISIIFVDEHAKDGEFIFDFPVIKEYELQNERVFFGVGDNSHRKYLFDKYGQEQLISILSDRAYYGLNAIIENGCFVGNFCHIGPYVRIGLNSIINNCANIDHEVIIGNHCHIGPNSTISGRTEIGDMVFIGVGATVIDKIKICSDVIIGAGATVVNDINEPGVYIGTPAVKIK